MDPQETTAELEHPKVKALSSRPDVAVTIDVGDTPTEAKALLVRGLASVDIVDGVPDESFAPLRSTRSTAASSTAPSATSPTCGRHFPRAFRAFPWR